MAVRDEHQVKSDPLVPPPGRPLAVEGVPLDLEGLERRLAELDAKDDTPIHVVHVGLVTMTEPLRRLLYGEPGALDAALRRADARAQTGDRAGDPHAPAGEARGQAGPA